MKWDEMKDKQKESKSSKPASQQYIYQYTIQSRVGNTFTNKESIAYKDVLHNQLISIETLYFLPLNCLRGGVVN